MLEDQEARTRDGAWRALVAIPEFLFAAIGLSVLSVLYSNTVLTVLYLLLISTSPTSSARANQAGCPC